MPLILNVQIVVMSYFYMLFVDLRNIDSGLHYVRRQPSIIRPRPVKNSRHIQHSRKSFTAPIDILIESNPTVILLPTNPINTPIPITTIPIHKTRKPILLTTRPILIRRPTFSGRTIPRAAVPDHPTKFTVRWSCQSRASGRADADDLQ